ncbi:MAG: polyprenol monophosphomannose synthase [Nitrospinae bacterium]|nr:polyprenol monophosphomannose synthase [Nitrospinota bacterium]
MTQNSGAKRPDVSVVFPAYNEAKNIPELVRRVGETFVGSGATLEMIVVDDNSPDGTADVAEGLRPAYPNLKVLVRKNERGLATAVVRGWEIAGGRFLAAMDADLQHPPDVILRLYKSAVEKDADMAVASRKVAGGGTSDWAFHRVVISNVANIIAKVCLPVSLRGIGDTTTGAFLFKGDKVDLSKLSPRGFKIFLEVLVRGKFNKTVEVGYVFIERTAGQSKMSLKQDVEFVIHLLKLGLVKGEIAVPALITVGLVGLVLKFFG